ncbi:hypothetical protein R5R35_014606 [Gryllus longicercus]|uniref:Uncharacterized protein n=1 Tax=Gryllus longicercus TaxID=2509291 RepID=A0AAN9VY44_9ORTH
MFWRQLLLFESALAVVAELPLKLLSFIHDWLHFRRLANRFPGPPTRPIVGNLFDCGLFPDRELLFTDFVLNLCPRRRLIN